MLVFPALTHLFRLPQNRGVNTALSSASGKFGFVILCLFGLPFAGFGLFAFSMAIRQFVAPTSTQSFLYPMVFGVIFSGVGFGLMYLAIAGNKSYSRQLNLQGEHPSEPWLWREDWAAGRVKSRTEGNMVMSWVFAIFWNLISWTVAIFAIPQALKQKPAAAFFALLFPAAGICLLVYSIRQTIRFIEFGKTCFEMASVPGVIGRELQGTIQARFPHSPEHGVRLRLSCVHRVTTGSGNSSTTTENILWRDDAELNAGQLCAGPAGTTIPVAFHIPFDAQPTEKLGPRDEFLWLLEAMAAVPGVDYHDAFEVPVFRTAQSPSAAEVASSEPAFAGHASGALPPQQPTILVRPVAEGTEFYFPPARNKSFGFSTTLFAAIFGTVGYFLTHSRAPFIFPLAFGGFGVLLTYISVKVWLGTTRVVIGSYMTLQSGYLGSGSNRRIELPDIANITDRITAQQGGGNGTPYYDIEMTTRDGKKLTLGRTLRDKQETEWLVSEMRRLAGVKGMGAAAGTR